MMLISSQNARNLLENPRFDRFCQKSAADGDIGVCGGSGYVLWSFSKNKHFHYFNKTNEDPHIMCVAKCVHRRSKGRKPILYWVRHSHAYIKYTILKQF